MPMAGLGQGYLDFVQQDQQRQLNQANLARMLQQNQAAQQAQDARGPAFEALSRLLGPKAAPGGGIPPPPSGSPQGGPQAPPPGANLAPPPQPQAGPMQAPPQPQPAPQMTPPPPAAPAPPQGGMMPVSMPGGGGAMPAPPPPPFRPMPSAPAGGAPAPMAGGQIGAPPAAPATDSGVSEPKPLNLQKIVQDLKSSGVPPAKAMDVLDALTPIMNSQNKAELETFKVVNKAQEAAIHAYRATIQAAQASRALDIKKQEADRKQQQGDERIDVAREKIAKQAGGADNIVKWETDDSGNTVGGFTRSGKHIRLADPGSAKTKIEGFSDQDVKYWTEVLQKGGSLPPRLATTPGGKKLLQQVMHGTATGNVSPVEMLANQAEFMGEKAGQRTLGTRTANIEMAATEAAGLSALALKASDEWKRTGIKSLNDLQKYAQGKTASPTLRRFVAANTSFINAYARAINPQGVGTVADKEHAREMLEVAFANGDYGAAIDQLQSEIKTAQAAPGQVKESMRERFTGKPTPGPGGAWKVEKVE